MQVKMFAELQSILQGYLSIETYPTQKYKRTYFLNNFIIYVYKFIQNS